MVLTEAQKNRYKVLNRWVCEKYCTQKHNRSSIIISIKSSWDKVDPKVYMSSENNVKAILFLSFDDVEKEDDEKCCMSFEDGERIANFVRMYYDQVDMIIIHCDGGVSRSAGVCAGIMRVMEGSDRKIFRNQDKHPNMTCYLRTLKGFGYI